MQCGYCGYEYFCAWNQKGRGCPNKPHKKCDCCYTYNSKNAKSCRNCKKRFDCSKGGDSK